MNPTAIEHHLKLVLLQWGLIILLAQVFGRLGRRFGQPPAVGEIFAGLLVGPSFLGAFWPTDWPPLFAPETQQSLQLLGKLGLILLLFQVGMEFDYSHLRSRSKTVSSVSLMGIIAPVLGGLLIGPWLHTSFAPTVNYFGFQLFVCIALAITALPIMGRILLELRLERTPVGVLSISAAAIDDVIGWIGLAVITALATTGFSWSGLTGQVVGVGCATFFILRFVGPLLTTLRKRLCPPKELSPLFLGIVLVTLFGCCLLTNMLGIFSIFGSFLLGVSLHRDHEFAQLWRARFSDLVLVAFVPVFFTNTGLRTDIGSLATTAQWLGCLAVFLVAVAGKLGGCYFAARITGQSQSESMTIAALMNTRALMGLVAINVGYDLKLLPNELFTMFVIMALLTTAMTGPILKRTLPGLPHLRNGERGEQTAQDTHSAHPSPHPPLQQISAG